MDINSLVSQYLSNNKDVSLSDIQSALKNLRVSYYDFDNDCTNVDSDTSIFTMDESDTITQEEFLDIMIKATGKSESEIKDDVSLLFDIMDNEADGKGSLSKSEFSLFLNGDNVTSYSIWANLGLEEDRVKISSTSSSSTDDTNGSDSQTGNSNASAGTDGTTGTDGTSGATGTDGVTGTDSQNDSSNQSSSGGLNLNDPESIKNFLKDVAVGDYKNATNEELLDFCVEQGLLTEEEADTARNTFKLESLSAQERSAVQKIIDKGKTLDEAVEALGLTLDSDNSLNEKTNKEIDYKSYADDIWYAMRGKDFGTNEGMIESILFDASISDEDFAKIVEEFEKAHPDQGLVTYFMEETSFGTQDEWCEALAQRLVNAANNGDETAIKVLAREMYSGGAERLGTADEFYEAFFSSINDDALVKVNDAYEDKYPGHSFTTDVDDEFGFFSDKDEKYVAQIKRALRNRD